MGKTIVIGLDGATFKILRPWADKGYLPSIKKFFEQGTIGELLSTVPPITGPAWTAIATGTDPQKLNIFDFMNRRDPSYETRPINSGELRGKCVWNFLSESDRRVGIMGYPMLYPTYEINGFMISGFGAPGKYGKWSYPPEVGKELDEKFPGYEISPDAVKKGEDPNVRLETIMKLFEVQKDALMYLVKKEEFDLFVYVLSMTDWLQHYFWPVFDSEHPDYDEEKDAQIRKRLIECYGEFDAMIGELMEEFPDVDFILLSDHGFGPRVSTFDMKKWLEEKGYSAPSKSGGGVKTHIFKTGREIMGKLKLRSRFPIIEKYLPMLRKNLSPETSATKFGENKAYILSGSTGEIYLNVKGRDEDGCIEPGEYEKVREELKRELEKIPEEIEGVDSIEVHEPRKNAGNKGYLPEFLVDINEWSCCVCNGAAERGEGFFFMDTNLKFPVQIGIHRKEGVFLAYGPNVRKGGKLEGAKLVDIMPTLLFMQDVKIPGGLDGKVLDIFSEDSSLSGKKPEFEEPVGRIPGKEKLVLLKKKLHSGKGL